MNLAVPKLKVECLRPKEIEKYDYERIKLSLNEKFSKYRDYKERLDIIASKIKSRINDNVYHLEIFNKDDKDTIIEIHNKEVFINEELEKEVTDNNLI